MGFGWIMLNGHSVSDGLGLPTCFHSDVWLTVDYALVPRAARGDLAVLDVPGGGSDHRALLVTLRVHCPVVAVVVARPLAWAAVVRLALAEALAFWSIDWAPVMAAVDAVLAEAPLSRAQGERALAVFEEGVVARLAYV